MWGHQHTDQPTAEELRSPRFLKHYNAEDIPLLVDPQDAVSGICSLRSEGRRDPRQRALDLLDAPGIIGRYRELGYQRQLVLAGMTHLRQKGRRPILLEFWGDNPLVLGIYRRIGFEMLNRYIAYRREVE